MYFNSFSAAEQTVGMDLLYYFHFLFLVHVYPCRKALKKKEPTDRLVKCTDRVQTGYRQASQVYRHGTVSC